MTKYTKYEASTQVGGCEHPIFIYGQRPRHQHELQRHVVRLQVSEMTKTENTETSINIGKQPGIMAVEILLS